MKTGAKNFLITFFTSLFVSLLVCVLFFLYGIPFMEKVEVPDVRSATVERGRLILEGTELSLFVESEREDDSVPEGSIISQTPLPGSFVRRGTQIGVVVSKGERRLVVPDLSSVPLEEARKRLEQDGFGVGNITEQSSDSIPKGSVISTFPSADSMVKERAIIDVVLSSGKEEVLVPNVLGRRLAQAKEVLEKVGLRVGEINYICDEDKLFDIILRQDPRPGIKVPKATAVNITINVEEEE